MTEFFAMDGYAFYVWPSYLIAAAAIGGLAIQTIVQWRRAQARLRALEADSHPATPHA